MNLVQRAKKVNLAQVVHVATKVMWVRVVHPGKSARLVNREMIPLEHPEQKESRVMMVQRANPVTQVLLVHPESC